MAVINTPLESLLGGDATALALKEYAGMVFKFWSDASVFTKYIMKKTVTQGDQHQFPAIGQMTATAHTAGTDLPGVNHPPSAENIVTVDEKEVVAHNWKSTVQTFLQHFDDRQITAEEAAKAVAREIDSRVARCIANGALAGTRTAGDTTFPGGTTVTAGTGSGVITTAYPVSLVGSRRLQELRR